MILWGATIDDDDETTLSWFASGEPGIKDGTREMVLAMMKDLGYQVSDVASFAVRHLKTNYLDGKTWAHAWEVTAKLPARVAELPLQGRSVESKATDATFGGALPAGKAEHVLFPGDRLFIPDTEQRKEVRATDAAHVFQAAIPRLFLRVKLLDVDGQPLKGVPCEVTVPPDNQPVPQSADGAGILEQQVPRSRDMTGRIVAQLTPKPPAVPRSIEYDLLIGNLDPQTELVGQQARLGNLGYFAGYAARDLDALLWAAEEFRCDHVGKRIATRPPIKPAPPPVEGEPPERSPDERSGIDDAALTKKLRDVHGI